MKAITRIFYSILRNKYYLLYFLSIIIMMQVLFFTIQANVSNKRSIENMRESIGTQIVMKEKMQLAEEEMGESIPFASITLLADLPEVKYYDYTMSHTLYSNNIERVKHINQENPHFKYDSFDIIGVQYPDIFESMKNEIVLQKGRGFSETDRFSESYVALISHELADKNGIEVGDVLPMEYRVYTTSDSDKSQRNIGTEQLVDTMIINLEIIGFYENKPKYSNMNNADSFVQQDNDNKNNTFYVLNNLTKQLDNFSVETLDMVEEQGLTNVTFELTSRDAIESFKTKAQNYVPKGYEIYTIDEIATATEGMINSSQKLLYMVLVAAIVLSLLIFLLITFLILRERKRELGILYTLGLSKKELTMQIVAELGIVTFSGFIVSILISRVVTVQLLQKFLLSTSNIDAGADFNVAVINNIKFVDYVSVDISWITIGIIAGIIIVLLLLISIFIHIYLEKISPKEILME